MNLYAVTLIRPDGSVTLHVLNDSSTGAKQATIAYDEKKGGTGRIDGVRFIASDDAQKDNEMLLGYPEAGE